MGSALPHADRPVRMNSFPTIFFPPVCPSRSFFCGISASPYHSPASFPIIFVPLRLGDFAWTVLLRHPTFVTDRHSPPHKNTANGTFFPLEILPSLLLGYSS